MSLEFIRGGHGIFTADNGKGEWFTYKVSTPKHLIDPNRRPYFLSLLTGPDNTSDYTYMGMLDIREGTLRSTRASKVSENAKSWQVALWALDVIYGRLPIKHPYAIRHEGRCGCCGRRLTTPESLIRGIGPECALRIGAK